MGFAFFEKMAGSLVDSAGEAHPFDIEVKIEAADGLRFLGDGQARMTGVVRGLPWADNAVLDGSFGLSPRGMDYRFTFEGVDEAQFTFVGRKDLSPLALARTISTLHSTLRKGEVELAKGDLRFDLSQTATLLRSYQLGSGHRRIELGGQRPGEPALPPLNAEELARARAFAEAVIVPGRLVPAVDDETMANAIQMLSGMPSGALRVYRMALKGIGAMARLRTGRRFESLSPARRRKVLDWISNRGVGGRGLVMLVGLPLKTGHFSRRVYLDAIGVPDYECESRERPPRWLSNVITPDTMDPQLEIEADVVVIGTGAGGGVIAAELAERGLGVAVVEEGVYAGRKDFNGPLLARMRRFYHDGGLSFSVGNAVVGIPTGKVVGGSTTINSGTCFRVPDTVLAEWRGRGFPDVFSAAGLDPWFKGVEAELQVGPGGPKELGKIAEIIAEGARQLGGTHHALPRNAPGCDGQGVCPFGCPTDAKRSTNVSYVPRALRAGASLFTGMPVTRIHMRGEQAVAVEARGYSASGERRVLRIKARAVVVACGTLRSPLLLQANGFKLPQIGRNLSVHPALGLFARCRDEVIGWDAIPQSYGVTGLVDPRVRFEGFYIPPHLSAGLLPLDGEQLTEWMDDQRRVAQYGFMVRDRNVGRVLRGPGGGPLVHYNLTPDVLDLMGRGTAVLAEMLLRGGAHEVLTAFAGVGVVQTIDQARRLAGRPVKARDVTCSAYHPLGTNRMGSNAKDGVVDFDHRVFGTQNLYVVDGSVMPSSLGVNPQITIMALASRAAASLAERLA